MWWTDWQTIVAVVCVAAAAAAILRRARNWLNGSAKSGCHSCPARQPESVIPLSSLKLSPTLKARQTAPKPKEGLRRNTAD